MMRWVIRVLGYAGYVGIGQSCLFRNVVFNEIIPCSVVVIHDSAFSVDTIIVQISAGNEQTIAIVVHVAKIVADGAVRLDGRLRGRECLA